MRCRLVVAICFVGFSMMPLCGQQSGAPQPQPAIIGTVTDIQNEAIPDADVKLEGLVPADHAAARSNAQGFFTFTGLRPGVPYHLVVAAKGFADWNSHAITLQPGQQLDLGDIRLNIAVVQTTVTAVSTEEIATRQVKAEEKQRVIGIFPNFFVTYEEHPAPLTPKLKFRLALRATIDPVNFIATGAFAGMNQAGDTPDYQQGAVGYAQRYGSAYADGFTNIMVGGAILPSLLHQDPRYFYKGTGSVKSRILHAAAFSVLCKGDNGRWQFNYSSIGGDLASGAISNIYYPPSNRSASLVFVNALLGMGGRVADDLAQEFVFKKLTTRRHK
ncbi:MAG TPA: carboxypeptidase-like regulatory domain-containing protein [Acidobacteriaceae bacterium]|nr:carboxypeptidase-like regulatory domain-containing protein [Acidobacteriaceae bacterium]